MRRIASLLLAGAIAAWSQTPPPNSKISPDLANIDPQASVRVIVQWTGAPNKANNNLIGLLGGTVLSTLKAVSGLVCTLTGSALQTLAANPNVSYITPDRPLVGKLDLTAAAVNASALWEAGWEGNGVGVAVVDSGINADPNLGPGKKFSYDFTNPNNAWLAETYFSNPLLVDGLTGALVSTLSAGPDQYGHGQHVAGIIASNGLSSSCSNCERKFKGIAPGVNLIDLRVLDQNGQGNDSSVILAIDAAIALKRTYNIRVMNLSLGRPVYESYTLDPLCEAVEAAWKAGIAVVVAAGNDGRDNTFGEQGYGTISSPGNDPYVITVGAMKTDGTPTRADDYIATYSSKGRTQIDHIVKPDVVAPGNLIVSLLAQNSTLESEYPANRVPMSYFENNLSAAQGQQDSANYFILSGTSMAAAVVSGAAADLFQANPSLTPDQVKALLMQTATKNFPASSTATDPTTGETFTDYYDIFTIGAGYIDLAAALSEVKTVPSNGNALSPTATQNADGSVTVNFDPASYWSTYSISASRAVWGYQSVWGTSVLEGQRAVWGYQSVWGYSSEASASSAVWGTRAVWGYQSMWGTSSDAATSTDDAESLNASIFGEQ